MNLTLSPRAQARLGVSSNATAAQVIAGLDRLRATSDARATAASTPTTPLVAKLADQLGVDLSRVSGSGVGDRVRASDVRQAAGLGPVNASASRTRPMEQQIDALSDDEVLALIGISSGGAAAEHAVGGPSLTGPDIDALTDDQIAELWS